MNKKKSCGGLQLFFYYTLNHANTLLVREYTLLLVGDGEFSRKKQIVEQIRIIQMSLYVFPDMRSTVIIRKILVLFFYNSISETGADYCDGVASASPIYNPLASPVPEASYSLTQAS